MKKRSSIWEYADSIGWAADYMLNNGNIVMIQAYGQDKKMGLPLPEGGIPVKDPFTGQIIGYCAEFVGA